MRSAEGEMLIGDFLTHLKDSNGKDIDVKNGLVMYIFNI